MHAGTMVFDQTWRRLGPVGERERHAGGQYTAQIGQGDIPPGLQSLRFVQSRQHLVRYQSGLSIRSVEPDHSAVRESSQPHQPAQLTLTCLRFPTEIRAMIAFAQRQEIVLPEIFPPCHRTFEPLASWDRQPVADFATILKNL
jgi:hypothetical protein